ncbi:MAG: hypothetical protein QM817_02575 [Archangium sp.]
MIPDIERTSPGQLMAFTAAELKILRGVKGDPARREWVKKRKKTRENTLELNDSWSWIDFMCGKDVRPFVRGTKLHKGQFSRLQLFDLDVFLGELNKLPQDEAGLQKKFDALSEEGFRYSYVPFWFSDKWKAAGITTIKTKARGAEVIEKLTAARVFIDATQERGEKLLFFCDYRD